MSEEIPLDEQPQCDPEFDADCELAGEVAEYTNEDGQYAVLFYGITAVVNSLLPTFLWFFWKDGGDALNVKSLLWWGWYAGWILHAALWLIPTILWPLTYLEVDFINYLFVFWANMIIAAPFSFYWVIATILFLAALFWEDPNKAGLLEHWLTFSIYLVIASLTGWVQLWYLEDVNLWYYLDVEPTEEEEEVVAAVEEEFMTAF